MALYRQPFASCPFETGRWNQIDFTIGSEADTGTSTGTSNQVSVSCQFKDGIKEIAEGVTGICYLSDDANGNSIAATAPDGGVSAGTDGALEALVAGKVFLFTTEADGDLDINIIKSTADVYYLVFVAPDGKRIVSGAITFV